MPYRVTSAEFARLSSLYRYGVLDTAAEPAIDAAVRTLAARLDVPVAQLVFADAQRFWVKSAVGPAEPLCLRGRGLVEDVLTQGPAFQSAVDRGEAMPPGQQGFHGFAGLRLLGSEDEALGVLYVGDTGSRDLATQAAVPLAEAAAEILAVIESARRTRHDAGTGALELEAFLDQARRLIDVTRMGRQWISLVTFDLAPLRAGLERKGAGLGSLVVRHMADLGRTQVRRRDSFGRLGEDLFAILLTDTGEAGAGVLAQRLNRHLERGWTDAGLVPGGLDLGISSLKPTTADDTVEVLMTRAAATRWSEAATRPAARMA